MSRRSARRARAVTDASKTLLVVQSDVLLRAVVADYLRRCGYTIVEALSGEEALAILKGKVRVDAVLTDVKLQGDLDGFAVAQWLRSHAPDVEVVLTSGIERTAEKAFDLCSEGPAGGHPETPEQLARRLQVLFARRKATKRQ